MNEFSSRLWRASLFCSFMVALSLTLSPKLLWGEWPSYRGNAQRTAYAEQSIPQGEWIAAWTSDLLAEPGAAWPAPARGSLWQNLEHLESRLTADAGLIPLIVRSAQGRWLVLVASSADNCLLAWEAESGRVAWEYLVEAPIRFAPEVRQGVAYFGADDGVVRAVDVDHGHELWSATIGPDLPWIYGNGNIISPHPIRTSVLVHNDRLLAHAGLFPGQGVYAVALNLQDGQLLWRKRIDRSPQGYLLTEPKGERLFVPTGRAQPFMSDIDNGELLGDLPSPGGDFCVVTQEAYFAGPGNAKEMVAYSSSSQSEMLTLSGGAVVVGGGMVWNANGTLLQCQRLAGLSNPASEPVWQVDCPLDADMLVLRTPTGTELWIAGGSTIEVYDALDGRSLQQLQLPMVPTQQSLPERIVRLAVSQVDTGGLLVATTSRGRVAAWSCKPTSTGDRTHIVVDHSVGITRAPMVVPSAEQQQLISSALPGSKRGLACVVGEEHTAWVQWLLENSQMQIVWVQTVDLSQAAADGEPRVTSFDSLTQRRLLGLQSDRVSIWQRSTAAGVHVAPGLLNLLVKGEDCPWSEEELLGFLAPGSGKLVDVEQQRVNVQEPAPGAGAWRHQYASPANTSSSDDEAVGQADYFRLQWFGGVGPSRIPDRHLRGPAPLAAGNSLVIHGDGLLIGVDPANGIERWQLDLPLAAMRYVMPYDGAHSCLSTSGDRLYIAAAGELWTIDSTTGKKLARRPIPADDAGYHWGYVAESSGGLLASCMKPTAPRLALERTAARSSYSDQDYRSRRPLVCSRVLYQFAEDGRVVWQYKARGLIPHGTISIDDPGRRLVFLEGRSEKCQQHESDRVGLKMLLENAWLVCLDEMTGQVRWEHRIEWPEAENVLFTQMAQERVVLVSSRSVGQAAEYLVRVLDLKSGELLWKTEHQHVREGLYHGEQVHHPVLLERDAHSAWLVAEPYIYDLHTGLRQAPQGASQDWSLNRPGHSCGTITGAGSCLFFRANNPTVLDLETGGEARFIKLAPTRTSCWINMLPACGKLIIPEGSAGCVCAYPLQTSLAFTPMTGNESIGLGLLPDVVAE